MPLITQPDHTDLFGTPIPGTGKTSRQLHGTFVSKYEKKGDFFVILQVTGSITIHDDVLNEGETRQLTSTMKIYVPARIYSYPFTVGRKYILTTTTITSL